MSWHQGYEISTKGIFKLLMFCSLVSLLLLPKGLTDLADRGLWWLLKPISQGGRSFILGTDSDTVQGEAETVPVETYRQAVTEIHNLEQQLRQTLERARQLSGLREMFGEAPVSLIGTQVVGGDATSWRDILILNRSDLKPGQIVLSGVRGAEDFSSTAEAAQNRYKMCVVGQISEDDDRGFRLQLLTDVDFSMPVFIEPSWNRDEDEERAYGILKGQQGEEVTVSMVQDRFPVKEGDAVIARSDSLKLPVGMLVGFVKSCRRDPESPVFWQITMEPAADLVGLQYVYVLGTQWDK